MNPRQGLAVVLGMAGLLLAAQGCSRETPEVSGLASHEHMASDLPESAEGARVPGESLYNLESVWRDQDGAQVPLPTLRGMPRLVAMIYTNCQYECPLLVDQMQR
ncbi:MAG TPA: hypothetical protein VL359_01615, partial [bacterium]|nr:hypothetical protein [bacterium]